MIAGATPDPVVRAVRTSRQLLVAEDPSRPVGPDTHDACIDAGLLRLHVPGVWGPTAIGLLYGPFPVWNGGGPEDCLGRIRVYQLLLLQPAQPLRATRGT